MLKYFERSAEMKMIMDMMTGAMYIRKGRNCRVGYFTR